MRGYLGSAAMAMLMSVLTWVWLYSEGTVNATLEFDLKPRVSADANLAWYDIKQENGAPLPGNRIRVEVTGPRGVVELLRPIPCEPGLEEALFAEDQGSFQYTLQREHFPLPQSVQLRFPPRIKIEYAKYVTVPVEVGPPIAVKVNEGLKAIVIHPPIANVSVPADLKQRVLDGPVPIQRIDATGRTESFPTDAMLELPHPSMRQVGRLTVDVRITRDFQRVTIEGVPLQMAGPPEILQQLTFRLNRVTVAVELEGPREQVEALKAADLFAFVRVSHLTEADLKTSPIVLGPSFVDCEIPKDRRSAVTARVVLPGDQVEIDVKKQP